MIATIELLSQLAKEHYITVATGALMFCLIYTVLKLLLKALCIYNEDKTFHCRL